MIALICCKHCHSGDTSFQRANVQCVFRFKVDNTNIKDYSLFSNAEHDSCPNHWNRNNEVWFNFAPPAFNFNERLDITVKFHNNPDLMASILREILPSDVSLREEMISKI